MSTPSSGAGAVPLGPHDDDPRAGRPAWLIPVLAVVAALLVGLLVLLLLQGDDDDEVETAAPSASPSASASSATPLPSPGTSDIATSSPTAESSSSALATTAPPGGDSDIALTAGTEDVFPLESADQDLTGFSGEVLAVEVPVESVPADEGFWLGTGPDQRVWVEIIVLEGETPFVVEPGDVVSFTDGEFVPHDATYAERLEVTTEEGGEQLTSQAAHIQVRTADLRAG